MGGLALGSALLGRWADRARSPLRLFALLEAGVGLYAFAFPALLNGARAFLSQMSISPEAGAGELLLTKAVLAGGLLVPPTLLMGGTFPAMLRHVTVRAEQASATTPFLYGVNAAGAVFGALGMAFILLPQLGLAASLMTLAWGNLVVAALAALVPSGSEPVASPGEQAPLRAPASVRFLWFALCAAGALSFALEVTWTRYLGIVLGSSTDSFAIILASFISGIALGSLALARLGHRIADPLGAWGFCMIAVAALLLAPLPLYMYLPWVFKQLVDLLAPTPSAFVFYGVMRMALCLLLVLPVTMLVGLAVPLGIQGSASGLRHLGGLAGRAYAWNTLGNVAGALATGLFLLPAVGMERLLRLIALGWGLLGFGVLFFCAARRSKRRTLVAASALIVLVAGNVVLEPWQTAWLTLSPFRRTASRSFDRVRKSVDERNVLLEVDDPAAHLLVTESSGDEGLRRSLFVNGKPDASSGEDMPTQVLSGHLPLLLHPEAHNVLVIGLASGVTAGATLAHPVERLVVVDIVAAMPRAAEYFSRWNGDPLDDPRTRFIAADARDYLFRTSRSFDVIISEPSNPWMAGTAALFTREFYERAASRLAPDGIYLQWVQAYEFDDELFAVVVRTFRRSFVHVYGFHASGSDVLLLGTRRPLSPDWESAQRRFDSPGVKRQLLGIGIRDLDTLLSFQFFSPGTSALIADQTPLENTDDNRLIEIRAPRSLFTRAFAGSPVRLDERLVAAPSLLVADYRSRSPAQDPGHLLARMLGGLLPQLEERPSLRLALQRALLRFDPGFARQRAADRLLPASLRALPPPAFGDVTRRLLELHSRDARVEIDELLGEYGPMLLIEAALSERRAEELIGAVQATVDLQLSSPRLARFRIEALMASRRLDEAEIALREWIDRPGASLEWASLLACRLPDPQVCDETRAALRARRAEPIR